VIEDNFVAGRPQWEKAGAELVADVIPFEEMKLRMLNGSHSFLAYLGYLAGYQHINDCMEDELSPCSTCADAERTGADVESKRG
jgi:fructuronate reductase